MSYLSLYRRYRPLTFEEVVGQQHVIQALKNAYERNKIVHAYLFSGPRGTGKTTVAKCFARLINQFDESNVQHADIIEIDAASHNGVDDVREIIDRVKYSPLEAKYKVYIIDEVHMLSNGAFNALLKTLEEPPEHVVFILATTEIHKVLPTIISRTQRYDFLPVNKEQIYQRLVEVCQMEKVEYEIPALKTIATLSDGGLRDALTILEQVIAYSKYPLTIDDVIDVYKLVTLDDKIDFIKKLVDSNLNSTIEKMRNFKLMSVDFKLLINDLIIICKDVLTYKLTKNSDYFEILNNNLISEFILDYDYQKFMNGLVNILENNKSNRLLEEMFEVYILNALIQNNINGNEIIVPKVESKPKKEIIEVKKEEKKQEINVKLEEDSIESIKNVSDELLIDLMVCADKNQRLKDQEIYKNIYIECALPQYYAISNSMISCQIVLSSRDFLVLSNDGDIHVSTLNQKMSLVNELLHNLYNDQRKILIINHQQFEKMTKYFLELYKSKKLPVTSDSLVRVNEFFGQKEETSIDKLKSVFKDIIVE